MVLKTSKGFCSCVVLTWLLTFSSPNSMSAIRFFSLKLLVVWSCSLPLASRNSPGQKPELSRCSFAMALAKNNLLENKSYTMY